MQAAAAVVTVLGALAGAGCFVASFRYLRIVKANAMIFGARLAAINAAHEQIKVQHATITEAADRFAGHARRVAEEARAVDAAEDRVSAMHRELCELDRRRRIEMGLQQEVTDGAT